MPARWSIHCAVAAILIATGAVRPAPTYAADATPKFAEPADEASKFQVKTVASGLERPCGLAFRPAPASGAPSELFVAAAGAGEVVSLVVRDDAKSIPAIDGFPRLACPAFGDAEIGPVALVFLTPTRLAVGEAGLGPGRDAVRIYALPESKTPTSAENAAAAGKPLDHAASEMVVGPVAARGGAPAAGAWVALTLIQDESLFAAAALSDDSQGASPWIAKAALTANRPQDLQSFLDSAKGLGGSTPSALAISNSHDAPYLVVGLAGKATDAPDSVLGFASPRTGARALSLACGLRDVVALAYSPSGRLYAADAAWRDDDAAGVYRLDAAIVEGVQACRPVRIAKLARPMGLAFGPDGSLYASDWGDGDAGGRIVKIEGAL